MSAELRGGILRTTLLAGSSALMLGLAAPAGAAGCGGEYVIGQGDTLSGIAAKCDSSVEALMDANPQITSPSRLSVGWRLTVPDGEDSGAEAAEVAAMPDEEGPVMLEGWIVNGQRCAVLATADGEEYGVISPDLAFISGRAVAVQGRMVDDPTCTGPRTVLVTELSTTEL